MNLINLNFSIDTKTGHLKFLLSAYAFNKPRYLQPISEQVYIRVRNVTQHLINE